MTMSGGKYEPIFKKELAIAYGYLGDEKNCRSLFKYLIEFSSKNRTEARQNKAPCLYDTTQMRLDRGVMLDLGGEHENAVKTFERSAHDCPGSGEKGTAMPDPDMAAAFLRCGHSLLRLGRFDESYHCLKNVPIIFKKCKLHGADLQFCKLEYFLPRLLLPLNQYELNPIAENRQAAREGIEEFIESFKENSEKLNAYLYCLHVKTTFPGAYAENDGPPDAPSISKEANVHPCKDILPEERGHDMGINVIILDRKNHYLCRFGSSNEVYAYDAKVKSLGKFPAICRLIDWYCLDYECEPGALIEDCERLSSIPGLDGDSMHKTENILAVAREAKEKASAVMLLRQDNA